jgi:phage pi2 protein 07
MFEIQVQLDEIQVEKLMQQELQKKLQQLESRYTYWSMEELCKQTSMSINNIKEKFFYDPRFPKYKVGGKWYMPAQECESFLLQWIKEQPRN